MRIYTELDLSTFEAWSGAVDTLERIRNEGKCDELEQMLEELFPDGMSDTELNDLLWFDDEQVFEWLGIRTEEQIREELDEALEEHSKLMDDFIEESEGMDDEEKNELWANDYELAIEELNDRINELEEELETI